MNAACIDIPFDVAKRGQRAVERFKELLERGESERMAEMLALQWAPRVETDSTFMADCRSGHDDGLVGESAVPFREKYRRATGSRPDGKFYASQLAQYPGDPKAWIGSKGELRKRCEELGVGWTGAIEVAPKDVEPPPEKKRYEVAPDIVNKRIARMEMENPGSVTSLSKKEKRDMREKVKTIASGKQD